MNKFKKALLENELNTVKLAELTGLNRPLISYMVNYKALPMPEDMLKITKVLKLSPKDLWEKNQIYINEVDYSPYKPKKEQVKQLITYVAFRVVTDCYKGLMTKENLQLCGYKSLQDWGMAQLKNFEKLLEQKKKEREKNERI